MTKYVIKLAITGTVILSVPLAEIASKIVAITDITIDFTNQNSVLEYRKTLNVIMSETTNITLEPAIVFL